MADPTSPAITERIKGYVNQVLLPTISDNIFTGNILLYRLFNGAPKTWSGGRFMEKSVVWQKSTQGGSFDGADRFDTAAEDNTIRLQFKHKLVYQPVTILGSEKALNKTEEGQIQLVTNQMDQAKMRLSDRLATMIYGDGTGNSGKDFQGLENMIDDGTNAVAYGGQTRASYGSALNGNRTASVGNVTLAHIAGQLDNATGTGGNKTEPNLMTTTKAIYSFVEELIIPTTQNTFNVTAAPLRLYATGAQQVPDANKGEQGFKVIAYRGVPIVADDACPTGRLYGINESEMDFYYVNDSELQSVNRSITTIDNSIYNAAPQLSACQFRGFNEINDQYAMTGQFIIHGEIITWNPRRHFVSTGITGS